MQEEKEKQLIRELCAELGMEIVDDEDATETLEDFRSNYHPEVIAAAANGDVKALIELRRGCGLPIFS